MPEIESVHDMTETIRLELVKVLPAVPHAQDRCVTRLRDLLKAKHGIEDAHLIEGSDQTLGEICIHFDPGQLSIAEVRELAHRAGAELNLRYGHLMFMAETMGAREARTIEARIANIAGVLEAAVALTGEIRIEFDQQVTDATQIQTALNGIDIELREVPEAGHRAASREPGGRSSPDAHDHPHDHGGLFGDRSELIFSVICGVLLFSGWLLSMSITPPAWVALGLSLAAYFFGGYYAFREAFEDLRAGRLEIDLLMLVSAVGAAILGEWNEGALLLFLFSLGHALEHYAMGRAKRAIESLADLAPESAVVRRDERTFEIPVDQLRIGDVVVVKPNERMPADGFVIQGQSSVNQAPITGESVPVDKRAVELRRQAEENPERLDSQYRVFAGTINGSGALEIQVTKLASESTLARVIQMVNEAETQKSPTQRFTDRFESYFVPSVLVLVVVLLFAGFVVVETFSQSFYRAMAVLVAASPCALAISTPSAVLSGVARAAKGGVLVKGGGPLENLGRINAIAFDKTGTLTEGKPRLTDVVAFNGTSEDELLRVAIAVEVLSDHPLATAVVQGGAERLKSEPILPAEDVRSLTGRGVQASLNGQTVHLGNESLFSEVGGTPLPDALRESVGRLKANGRTTMIVRKGEEYLGVLGLMDSPRSSAKLVVARLRALGIRRMIMLSGDNQQVASAVASEIGLDEARGDLMPDDKVKTIQSLNAQGGVAMVGDGVNDAPAMANATVGIAMGGAGSAVALETADVALMADDLNHLPFAVGLSRMTNRIIRQNLWISLGMVVFLVPATILGLRLGPAVLMHEGSTLLVVFNALRLLAYRDDGGQGGS